MKSIIVSKNGGLNLPTSAPSQSLTLMTLMAWQSFGFCFLRGPKYSERSSLREMKFSAPLQRNWRLLPTPTLFPKPLTSGSSAGVGWFVSAERALLAGCCWPLRRRFALRSKIVWNWLVSLRSGAFACSSACLTRQVASWWLKAAPACASDDGVKSASLSSPSQLPCRVSRFSCVLCRRLRRADINPDSAGTT